MTNLDFKSIAEIFSNILQDEGLSFSSKKRMVDSTMTEIDRLQSEASRIKAEAYSTSLLEILVSTQTQQLDQKQEVVRRQDLLLEQHDASIDKVPEVPTAKQALASLLSEMGVSNLSSKLGMTAMGIHNIISGNTSGFGSDKIMNLYFETFPDAYKGV